MKYVYNYYSLEPNSILQGIFGIILTVTIFPQMQLLCKGKTVLNFVQKFTNIYVSFQKIISPMTMIFVVFELPVLSSVYPVHYIFLCSWAQISIYYKIHYSVKNNFIPRLRHHINVFRTTSPVKLLLISF